MYSLAQSFHSMASSKEFIGRLYKEECWDIYRSGKPETLGGSHHLRHVKWSAAHPRTEINVTGHSRWPRSLIDDGSSGKTFRAVATLPVLPPVGARFLGVHLIIIPLHCTCTYDAFSVSCMLYFIIRKLKKKSVTDCFQMQRCSSCTVMWKRQFVKSQDSMRAF